MRDGNPAGEAGPKRRFPISPGLILPVPLFAATMLVCATLAAFGWWMVPVVLAVLAGLTLVPLIKRSVTLMLGGIILCTMAGIFGAGIDTPLFGATVSGIRVDQAGGYPGALIYRFTDGRVLAGNDGDVPVYGGSKGINHLLYTLHIAPVVGDGWSPGQPVTVWAVTTNPHSDMPRSDWSRASRGGVRAGSFLTDDIRKEIDRVDRRDGLTTVPNPVLIHWIDDPEAAVASQYNELFRAFCACTVVWIVLVVITLIVEARARAKSGSRGPR